MLIGAGIQLTKAGLAVPESTSRQALSPVQSRSLLSTAKQAQSARRKALPYPNTEERKRQKPRVDNDPLQLLTSTRTRSPVAKKIPSTRSRSKSIENGPNIETVKPTTVMPARLPKLSQNHSSYIKYHQKASELFAALPDKGVVEEAEPKMEVTFIAAFIKGITSESARDRLVDELRQSHPSINKKDGRIEILCEWGDVLEGMKRAGLLDGRGGKDKHNEVYLSKKKRLLDPRSQVETGFNNN